MFFFNPVSIKFLINTMNKLINKNAKVYLMLPQIMLLKYKFGYLILKKKN